MAAAERLIDELEQMDRGWYAGAIGWMDAAEDGEFCVGIRSALLRGPRGASIRRQRHRRRTHPKPSWRKRSRSWAQCCRC